MYIHVQVRTGDSVAAVWARGKPCLGLLEVGKGTKVW